MKRFLFSAAIVALLVAPAFGADASKIDRTITVSGTASIEAMPDNVILNFAVETSGLNASAAAETNAASSARVVAALKGMTAGMDSIKTGSYGLQPIYEYDNVKKKEHLTGYRAVNQVIVKTGKIKDAGGMIDAAVKNGANRVNEIRFELADFTPLCDAAINDAARRARSDAESAARAFNAKLGAVRQITPSCTTEQSPVPHYAMMAAEGMRAMSSPTPVEPGAVKVYATVNAIFSIGE